MTLDVLCMGRAGVDLYADQVGQPLEQVTSFSKYLGGCAANIAVGAARLGLKAGMLTRVADDALGRFVHDFLASEGVDVSAVRTDPKHLTGLAVLGIQPPDRFPLIFYRERCADIHLSPEDVDASPVRSTRALVVTGTGFSREPSRTATGLAVERAREAGAKVVLDIDARPGLWDGGDAELARELERVLPRFDLIVGTEDEVTRAGGGGDADESAKRVREASGALVVMKRGARGATAFDRAGGRVDGPPFQIEVLNTLGAGDGFMAGFLSGWLADRPLPESLRLGNAVGGIVASRHACAPAMPRRDEVDALIRRQGRVA